MEVHGRPGVLAGLQRVHKLFGDGLAEAHVIAAAAPEPAVTACQGRKHRFGLAVHEGGHSYKCLHMELTPLSVPAVVAAAVVEVAQAAVPGESVHDASRADGVHERSLPIGCDQKRRYQPRLQNTMVLILKPFLFYANCLCWCLGLPDLPLRRLLWVFSCRALSGQFQRSHANWYLHSSMPLWAPAATLLE